MATINLADLDQTYEETPAATDGVPPGYYQARLDEAILGETNDGKYPKIAFKLCVVSGPQAGAPIFWNMIFTGAEWNTKFNKADLLKLGYDGPPGGLDNPGILESFLGLFMYVQVEEKKDKRDPNKINRYIRLKKIISESEIEGGYQESGTKADYAPPPDEDIPF